MTDPEVNIRFNADGGNVPPTVDRLKELFDGLTQNIARGDGALKDLGEDVRRVASTARDMQANARSTGNDDVRGLAERVFSDGAGTVQGYEEALQRLEKTLPGVQQKAQEVMEAVKRGSMSYEEGVASMEKYHQKSDGLRASAYELASAVERAKFEMGDAEALNSVIGRWQEYTGALEAARGDLAVQVAMLQEMKKELDEHARALDKNAEGYAQQMAEIAQANGVLEGYAAKLRAVDEQLAKQQSREGDVWGSAKTLQGLKEVDAAVDKETAALGKLVEALGAVEDKAGLYAQKRAAVAEKAAAKAEAATQKEAAAQQETSYAMELAAMSKTQLAAETRKLIEARKQAAAVGDTEAYARLTRQLGQCRTAMRGLVQQQQVSKIAMLQQAQTVAQMGGQLESVVSGIANFGEAAENGSVNVTGLASSVMSLSMAIKAGLGPLGWALMIIQGLQMAWNAWVKSQKAAKEAALKSAEAAKKAAKAMRSAGEAMADIHINRWKEAEESMRRISDLEHETARKRLEVEQSLAMGVISLEARKLAATQTTARARLEYLRKTGKITEEEYAKSIRELEKKTQEQTHKESELGVEKQIEANNQVVDHAKENVNDLDQSLEDLYKEFKGLGVNLDFALDPIVQETADKIAKVQSNEEVINAKIEELKANNEKLKADIKNLGDINWYDKNQTRKLFDAAGQIQTNNEKIESLEKQLIQGSDEAKAALEKFAKKVNVAADKAPEALGLLQKVAPQLKELNANKDSADATLKRAELTGVQLANTKQNLQEGNKEEKTQLKSKHDITEALEEQLREWREQLEKVQRTGSLEEQKRVLMEQRREMKKGSEEWKKYTAQIRTLNQKMREERLSELARTQGPDAVMAELERLRGRVKEGSDAWKRYTKQLQGLEVQKIREEQQKLHRELEISTTYQRIDNRSRAKILEADRKRLRIEEEDLRRRIASTDDYALRKELTEALKENLQQQKYLAQNAAKERKESDDQLKNMRALGLQVKKGMSQRAMDANVAKLQKGYQKLQEAVNSGDADAVRKALSDCKKVIEPLGRMAADPAKVKELSKAIEEAAHMGWTVTESKKHFDKVRAVDSKTLQAKEKTAQATQKRADIEENAAADAQRQQAQQNTQKVQQATVATQQAAAGQQQLAAAVGRLQGAVQGLREQQAGLAPAVQDLSAAVKELGTSVGTGISALNAALDNVRGQINYLQKEIDSIWRKI